MNIKAADTLRRLRPIRLHPPGREENKLVFLLHTIYSNFLLIPNHTGDLEMAPREHLLTRRASGFIATLLL